MEDGDGAARTTGKSLTTGRGVAVSCTGADVKAVGAVAEYEVVLLSWRTGRSTVASAGCSGGNDAAAGRGAGAGAGSLSANRMIGESSRWTAVLTGDDRGATARSGPLLTVCGTTGRANPSTWPLGPLGSTTCPRGARKLGLCEVESEAVKVSSGATGRVAVTVGRIGGRSCQAARCTGAGDVDPVTAGAELPWGEDGSASPRLHQRATCSPPSFDPLVDPSDLPGKSLTLVMLEIEQVVERPVEMEGDVRDLLVDPVGRVRHYSPRRPPATSTANSWLQLGQVTAARVCPS